MSSTSTETDIALNTDQHYMIQALALAKKAQQLGEVPVGAIVVLDGSIIGRGFNQSITNNDPSAHAEIIALRDAANSIGNYRLLNTTLYVTLEPCPMCAGAMVHSRVKRLVYGAADPKSGSAGTVFNITQSNQLNHRLTVTGGVLSQQASQYLKAFFQAKR